MTQPPRPEERAVYRRLGLSDVIIEQVERVAGVISNGEDATNALGALYVLCSPYLKQSREWAKRWEARPIRHVFDEDSGEEVPVPSGKDILESFEIIMDGLSEAGLLFDRVRVSYVGTPGQEPPMGSPSVGGDAPTGTSGPSTARVEGGGHDVRPVLGPDAPSPRVLRGTGRPRKRPLTDEEKAVSEAPVEDERGAFRPT